MSASASTLRTAADPLSAAAAKARFWDQVARKYASDPIKDLAGYEKTLARVQALLSAEHEVLEIGCGTGSTALRLAPGVRRLLATDLSPEMITIAREKQVDLGLPNLAFQVADADLPLPDPAPFDAVLAFNLLHLLPDLPQALQSIAGALRPGGLFISKTVCVSEMSALIRRLALPLMNALGKVPPLRVFDTAQLRAAIEQSGLDIVAVERHATRGRDYRPFIVARKPG